MGMYGKALRDFEMAFLQMRGNQTMYVEVWQSLNVPMTCPSVRHDESSKELGPDPSRNYSQLGLAHTIHSAEILFNLGLTKINIGQTASGMIDLRKAQEGKNLPEHEVFDRAVRDQGRGYNVLTVPVSFPPLLT